MYNTRMYPYGCKSSYTTGYVNLKKSSGTSVYAYTISDSSVFSPLSGTLSAGTYSLEVTMYWQTVDVPDYTVRLISASAISITGGAKDSVSQKLLYIYDTTTKQRA